MESCETVMTFPPGSNLEPSSYWLLETKITFALTCSTMDRNLASGWAGSIKANAAPTFIVASTATTVHIDFSKHNGMISNSTPSESRDAASELESVSTSPYV